VLYSLLYITNILAALICQVQATVIPGDPLSVLVNSSPYDFRTDTEKNAKALIRMCIRITSQEDK